MTTPQLSTTRMALYLPILLFALLGNPAGFAAEWVGSGDCRAQLLDSGDEDDLPDRYEGKIVEPVGFTKISALGVNQARRQAVTVGQRNGLIAQIIEGVNEGDIVINHPGEDVEDWVRVKIQTIE